MPISKRLAMSEDQLNDLMMNTWNMRIATIGPGVEINLTPMWFGWAEGKILRSAAARKWSMFVATRCVALLSIAMSDSRAPSCYVSRESPGAGNCGRRTGRAGMDIVREQMGLKYAGGHGEPKQRSQLRIARGRGETARWIVFTRISRLLGITLSCQSGRLSSPM